jgi:hypothetical protein
LSGFIAPGYKASGSNTPLEEFMAEVYLSFSFRGLLISKPRDTLIGETFLFLNFVGLKSLALISILLEVLTWLWSV